MRAESSLAWLCFVYHWLICIVFPLHLLLIPALQPRKMSKGCAFANSTQSRRVAWASSKRYTAVECPENCRYSILATSPKAKRQFGRARP
ncbi:hypothetical protein BDW42DRAFT_165777, partial [Aspergillus taichungensis]